MARCESPSWSPTRIACEYRRSACSDDVVTCSSGGLERTVQSDSPMPRRKRSDTLSTTASSPTVRQRHSPYHLGRVNGARIGIADWSTKGDAELLENAAAAVTMDASAPGASTTGAPTADVSRGARSVIAGPTRNDSASA